MVARYVDVAGVRTYYERHGTGEPLLLLHGGFASAEIFGAMIPALAERFEVFVPERRGNGRTADSAEPFSYDVSMQETLGFMDALGIASAHVVGHSDGANIALLMGIREPDRVRRLVSISGNFGVNGGDHGPRRPRAVVNSKFAGLQADYRRLSPDGPDHLEAILAKFQSMWTGWEGISLDALATIQAPTLVMAADADFFAIDHTAALYQALPNGQLAIVPNTNHDLIRERADLVDELILQFLAEPGAAGRLAGQPVTG